MTKKQYKTFLACIILPTKGTQKETYANQSNAIYIYYIQRATCHVVHMQKVKRKIKNVGSGSGGGGGGQLSYEHREEK